MPPIDEQALEDALGQDEIEQEQEINQEVDQEDQEQQEEDQLTALEKEAADMGHTSKEEFVANGGDPERYKTAHEYVSYGKLQERNNKTNAKLDAMEEKFNKRLENVNKLHQQQLDAKVAALKADQRNAVEESDTEAYDKAQQEIDDLSVQKSEDGLDDAPPEDPAITAWKEKNPWVTDENDPKAQMVGGLWNGYVKANPDATIQSAIAYVDKQLEAMSPPQHNQRRDNVNITERGSQTTRTKGKINSVKQLSPAWQQEWSNTGFDLWNGNEKDFIQAALDYDRGNQ